MRTGRILKAGLLGPLRGVWQRAEEKTGNGGEGVTDGDANEKGKTLKKKGQSPPAVMSAMRVSCGGVSGGHAALLTRGCWPSRRTGGSGSAGPCRASPGCHLRGSVEVDWGKAA